MEAPPDAPPPRRSSALWTLLAVGVVAASGIGALVFSRNQKRAQRSSIDTSGFDLDRADAPAPEAAPAAQAAAAQPQSGLGMVTGAAPGMHFGKTVARPESRRRQAGQTFSQGCWSHQAQIGALAAAYTRRYPVIAHYGRDWMSYPDLKKLNDDYFRDHDAAKFLRGLAASPNFPKLVRKYATAPEIQGFVKDAMRQAPSALMASGLDLAGQDGTIKSIVSSVAQALGLPMGLLASDPGKIDQKAVMDSVLSNNPQVQKALDANPALQQQLQR